MVEGAGPDNLFGLLIVHGVHIYTPNDWDNWGMWEIYLTNEETGVSFESVLEKLAELPPDEVAEAFEDEEKENQWTNGHFEGMVRGERRKRRRDPCRLERMIK